MNYNTMKIEDIIKWCQDNNEVAWLKETASKTFTNEEGKERRISFIELKIEFVKKFMPEIAPKAGPKKPSMYDIIADLQSRQVRRRTYYLPFQPLFLLLD